MVFRALLDPLFLSYLTYLLLFPCSLHIRHTGILNSLVAWQGSIFGSLQCSPLCPEYLPLSTHMASFLISFQSLLRALLLSEADQDPLLILQAAISLFSVHLDLEYYFLLFLNIAPTFSKVLDNLSIVFVLITCLC